MQHHFKLPVFFEVTAQPKADPQVSLISRKQGTYILCRPSKPSCGPSFLLGKKVGSSTERQESVFSAPGQDPFLAGSSPTSGSGA